MRPDESSIPVKPPPRCYEWLRCVCTIASRDLVVAVCSFEGTERANPTGTGPTLRQIANLSLSLSLEGYVDSSVLG